MEVTEEVALTILDKGILAVPTETVYGLAARMDRPDAIEEIFRLKGRPRQNPLIIHVASPTMAKKYIASFPPYYQELVEAFWPGPLSLVLPCKDVPESVTAGLNTACFRMPSHPSILSLIEKTGPLVIPSANVSGRPSSTTRAHVEADFGSNFPVLASGLKDFRHGIESTILVFTDGVYHIAREGILIPEDFESTLGYIPSFRAKGGAILSPGSHFQHYSPKAKLLLEGDAEAVLGFEERDYALPKILLGRLVSPEQTAARLYSALREIDLLGYTKVQVDLDFPSHGLWRTIRERLFRAMGDTYTKAEH